MMGTVWTIFILVVVAFGFFVYLLKKPEQKLTEMPRKEELPTIDQQQLMSAFPDALTDIEIKHPLFQMLKEGLHKSIVGQEGLIHGLFIGLLTGGHVLIEGVPGLAKTKTVTTLAELLHVDCKRVQCTPDMLPSDLTGSEIFHNDTKQFQVVPGPLFANIVLADEINRTTPKVQAALLEAMQEHQVTIGGKTMQLPKPFFVLATQNPIDHEGTYPLPEAQVDRFLCKLVVTYPSHDEEIEMVREAQQEKETRELPKVGPQEIVQMQEEVSKVKISEELMHTIVEMVRKTRSAQQLLTYGASPRASLALVHTGKAIAYLAGRTQVELADIEHAAVSVLRHRVAMSYQASQKYTKVDDVLRYILTR